MIYELSHQPWCVGTAMVDTDIGVASYMVRAALDDRISPDLDSEDRMCRATDNMDASQWEGSAPCRKC